MSPIRPDAREIREWISQWLNRVARIAPDELDLDRPFADYGLGSRAGVRLASDLEKWLGRRLPPTLAWDHPTVNALTAHLGEILAGEA